MNALLTPPRTPRALGIRRLLAITLSVLAASSMVLVSCADETIPLANLPPLIEAGDAVVGERCSDTDPCSGNSYCDRPSCDAPAGVCKTVQVCGGVAPVCGCDGITYLNDCTRQLAGVSLMYDNSCQQGSALTCHGNDDCRGGTCIFFSDPGCRRTFGTCWALGPLNSTSDCPAQPGFQRWDTCGGLSCLDTCHALLSNQPIHPSDAPCPPH